MLIVYALCILAIVFVSFGFAVMFIGPKGKGIPFVPTSKKKVRTLMRLSEPLTAKRMADLGSGDGRIVIAFARAGVEAHGFELNPVLVLWARMRIRFLGLKGRAHIHLGNYWNADLSQFDIVTVYGLPGMMGELERKLRRELRPGARVFSNNFHFPTLTNVRKEEGVYLYSL